MGVPVINFHSSRHTFATHFLLNGGALFQLKVLLGHADLETTLRYSHVNNESLIQASSLPTTLAAFVIVSRDNEV